MTDRQNGQEVWKPIPDPTTLTTDAVDRAVRDLTTLFTTKLDAQSTMSNERFASIDRHIAQVEKAFQIQYAAQKASFNLIVSLLGLAFLGVSVFASILFLVSGGI